ncbi:1-deoxy-D-xylulose-5-phosphate synthase N-terminal domain-containing protein [Streptomyces sp. ME19-03-3]|nr:1-deoxy-D-xylulose-5-phosphate synthase N-terminal domain-containing protein [Streptomyces sp. ME19-03-3]
MSLLARINHPADLRGLSHPELVRLAAEIRGFLIRHVAATGGHLGPNLGVVELTLALHRVFDSPRDRVLWDVGHQAYVHKIVTGRAHGFTGLRQRGGLSGYPSREESAHDHIEHSHASAALSYADGMAKARRIAGEADRHIVAVVGDGALTGGLAWEALNNIAEAPDRPVVIVLNDNGRSYAPTVGGLALHRLGATLVLDRSGVTGDDGPSHNGLWDLAMLQAVPGLRIAAPRDARTLREQLRQAVSTTDAPTVLRYPRGAVGPPIPAAARRGAVDVLREARVAGGVLLVSVGTMAPVALEAAAICAGHGVEATVVDPQWVKPLPAALLALAADHALVVTVEDGLRTGGVGTAVARALQESGVGTPVRVLGVADGFPRQASRAEILAEAGLTAQGVADAVTRALAGPAVPTAPEVPVAGSDSGGRRKGT